MLGGNIRWDGAPGTDVAGQLGLRVARFPLDARVDPAELCRVLRARGIEPAPVVGSLDAFKRPHEDEWIRDLAWYADRLDGLTTYIQICNEPDGEVTEEGASWRMSAEECNVWIAEARRTFPRPRFKLIGPGLVSGNPNWVYGMDLDKLDLLAVNAYAKEPGDRARTRLGRQHPRYAHPKYRYLPGESAPLDSRGVLRGVPVGPMLRAYQEASGGMPLAITEWHSGTLGMAAYLRDHPGVELATVFTAQSYLDFGLVDHPEAAADFLAAAGGPVPMPEPEFRFILGFLTAYQSNPALVGEPVENEQWPLEGLSTQRTSRGVLFWSAHHGIVFTDYQQGGRYVFRNGRLERAA